MSSEQVTTYTNINTNTNTANTAAGTASSENTVQQARHHSEKKVIDQDNKKKSQGSKKPKKKSTDDNNDETIDATKKKYRGNNRSYFKKQYGTLNKQEKHDDNSNNKKNKKEEGEKVKGQVSQEEEEEQEEGDACFICTEPIVTYAVTSCNHRTCHLCSLRLRALYENKNCVYCKMEQKAVIFTKDATKLFEEFTDKDICYVDKKLDIRFESELIHQDTKLLLQYNCPDPKCDISCSGWNELKKHANNDHNLQLCDLCIKNKKIFAHEHTLFTYPQLNKHLKSGDKEDSGFGGHPECQFCRKRFYGNDELFLHCREKHEQCHICVRNGIRHQYYADYNGLEKHFRNDHYLCMYRECLDQKFIVFESELDLKAHEVEIHGASGRVDLNFEYGYRPGSSSRQKNKQPQQQPQQQQQQQHSSTATSTLNETVSISGEDFPSIHGNSSSNTNTERTIPGQPKKQKEKQQQQQRLQKPKGFGNLSEAENWPVLNKSSSGTTESHTSTTTNNHNEEDVQRHAEFLRKVATLLNGPQGVEQFRALTTAYRNNTMDSTTYVKEIRNLCGNDSSKASTILKGVENLMDKENKKKEILNTWRNTQATEQNFPALTPVNGRSSVGHASSKRVLVIKEGSTRVGGTKTTSKSRAGVWDRVANAANNSTSLSTTTNNKTNSNNGSPVSSRPNSPMFFPTPQLNKNKTAWAGTSSSSSSSRDQSKEDFPSISQQFPSLPNTKQTHPTILNMRRNNNPSGQSSSAWSPSSPSLDNNNNNDTDEGSSNHDKKKKGKKGKQVLFRVGL
ncbi:hypothetical protein BJ944DRAFT_202278 [Cunninghamella echinulata]|nr:hypothetical protein BJ944DRAFT_202278 [Cunninghamella echinulata]